MTHEKVLEAALFMTSRPLMLDELGKILGVNSLGYVKELLEKLQKDYAERGMEIVSGPSGWFMQVRPHLLQKVAHLTPYSDMTEGCKRALALIAYKEPMQQSEIIKIQGNKAYSYLKVLQKRNLVRAEKKGRTKLFRLTQEFERYFGEEKERIKERLESSQRADSRRAQKKKEAAILELAQEKEETGVEEKFEEKQEKSDASKPKKKSDIDNILL
jgi:segregation and condensation protein B